MSTITSLPEGINAFQAFQNERFPALTSQIKAGQLINVGQLKSALDEQGGITEAQRERLVKITNVFAEAVSKPFNREFRSGTGPILCCDVFAEKEGKCLVHENTRGKLVLTGGGILDPGETARQAVEREFWEETGKGCKIINPEIFTIKDVQGGAPEQRVLFVHEAKVNDGTPQANHEALSFKLVGPQELAASKPVKPDEPDVFFPPHRKLLEKYFENREPYTLYIPYMSDGDRVVRQIKPTHENPQVNACLDKIEQVYTKFTGEFNTFAERLNNPLFAKSCKDHGWGGEPKVPDFNDDEMLWNWLGPFKMAAIEVSKLFGTHISTGEGGVPELVQVAEKEGRIAVVVEGENFSLPRTEMIHGETFAKGLANGPLEIEGRARLRSLHEDPKHVNKRGQQVRSCLFETRAKGEAEGVSFMTPDEIRALPPEKWNPFHYKMLESTGIFGELEARCVPCTTRREATNAPMWFYNTRFSSYTLPPGKTLEELTPEDLGDRSCVRGEDAQGRQFYIVRYVKNETSTHLITVYESDDPNNRWKLLGNPFNGYDYQVMHYWFLALTEGKPIGELQYQHLENDEGYYYVKAPLADVSIVEGEITRHCGNLFLKG